MSKEKLIELIKLASNTEVTAEKLEQIKARLATAEKQFLQNNKPINLDYKYEI